MRTKNINVRESETTKHPGFEEVKEELEEESKENQNPFDSV